MERIRLGMLRGLGFTRRQLEVIEYMAAGYSNNEIEETMGIKYAGLKKHREKIIKMGNKLFPINDFKTAADIVNYLQKQGII